MIRDRIENTRLLGRAILGNAFEGKPGYFSTYIQEASREEPHEYNPRGEVLAAEVIDQAYKALSEKSYTKEDLLTIPWASRRGLQETKIKPSRLAASIIAFSDVQGKRTVDEYFPVGEMQTFLADVQSHASENGKPLTIPEQFAVALQITDNNPVAASLLAHSAYRAVARGKETKISPDLAFSREKVLDIARSTADFHTVNSPSRDPLGDTYHWWASFCAGLGFTLSKEEFPIQSRLYTTAFYHEATLTTFVRKTVLRRTNISNHHKDVDRQGLQVGITVGNFLKNYQ